MNTINFYKELYSKLEKPAPLGFDCGRLCGAGCCQVSPELPGMYLFPGEEELFGNKSDFSVSESSLPGYGQVMLLSCNGTCDRAVRPLSCRVFPLAPKVSGDGVVTVRPDPRGRPVCPLCSQPASALSGEFRTAVAQAFAVLLAEPETAGFVLALSAAVDEYEKPFL